MIPVYDIPLVDADRVAEYRTFEVSYGLHPRLAGQRAFDVPHGRRGSAVIVSRADPVPTLRTITSAAVETVSPWRVATSTSADPVDDRGRGLAVRFAPVRGGDAVPSRLAEIRRMTGWSGERLARALGVSRQALHGWTAGREVSRPNAERLAKLHATLSHVDRGSAEENRTLLNGQASDGGIVAELLDAGRFEEVRRLLGAGGAAPRPAPGEDPSAGLVDGQHWFDRLATTGGVEAALEPVNPPAAARRVTVRRG